MESTKQAELERDFALQEGLILRQLTLKLDPKWQETILEIAREDTATGSPSAGCRTRRPCTTDPAAIGGEPGMLGDGQGRRRTAGRDGGGGGGPAAPRPPRDGRQAGVTGVSGRESGSGSTG